MPAPQLFTGLKSLAETGRSLLRLPNQSENGETNLDGDRLIQKDDALDGTRTRNPGRTRTALYPLSYEGVVMAPGEGRRPLPPLPTV